MQNASLDLQPLLPLGVTKEQLDANKIVRFPGPETDPVEDRKAELTLAIQVQVSKAQQHTISDQASLDVAETFCKELMKLVGSVRSLLDPLIAIKHQEHSAATQERASIIDPAEKVRKTLKQRMQSWLDAEREKARAEQERRDREALRKQAELMAGQREMTFRQVAKQGGRTDLEITAYLVSMKWPTVREIPEVMFPMALRWAQNPPAPAMGASTHVPAPFVPPPPPPPPPAPMPHATPAARLSGGSYSRYEWTYEVTNLLELVQAAARGAIPVEVLQVNDAFVSDKVASLKGSLRYPGIRVFEKSRITNR